MYELPVQIFKIGKHCTTAFYTIINNNWMTSPQKCNNNRPNGVMFFVKGYFWF